MARYATQRQGRTRGGAALALLAALALGAAGSPAGAEPPTRVGQVLALVGEARAVAPDGRVRRLQCFDRIHADELVFTERGSRVGILSAELYAQLDPGANVLYGETEAGIPSLRMLAGAVRLVDTRPGGAGPLLRVETPEGRMRSLGADTRVAVERWDVRERTRVCESASPVEIARFRPTDAIEEAAAGQCAVVTSAGRLAMVRHEARDRVALAGTDACQVEDLGLVAARLTPTDVAAPPFEPPVFPERGPAVPADRDPCDDPGSGCAGLVLSGEPPSPDTPVRQDPPTGDPGGDRPPPPGF